MDIATGVYTVIKPAGYYTITFSGSVHLNPEDALHLSLYHNGTQVPETKWDSYKNEANAGRTVEQGSRTVILHLNPEDTLEIRTDSSHFYYLADFMFCLSLTEQASPY